VLYVAICVCVQCAASHSLTHLKLLDLISDRWTVSPFTARFGPKFGPQG
jgi:hypothetical protein